MGAILVTIGPWWGAIGIMANIGPSWQTWGRRGKHGAVGEAPVVVVKGRLDRIPLSGW